MVPDFMRMDKKAKDKKAIDSLIDTFVRDLAVSMESQFLFLNVVFLQSWK